MLVRIVAALCTMLEDAIGEIRKHNDDYHHRTSEETLTNWEAYIRKVRTNL